MRSLEKSLKFGRCERHGELHGIKKKKRER